MRKVEYPRVQCNTLYYQAYISIPLIPFAVLCGFSPGEAASKRVDTPNPSGLCFPQGSGREAAPECTPKTRCSPKEITHRRGSGFFFRTIQNSARVAVVGCGKFLQSSKKPAKNSHLRRFTCP